MHRCGSDCGARPGCRLIWSTRSISTCAGRSPTPASRKGWPTWATTRWICRRRNSRALCAAKSRTTSASSGTQGSSRSSESLERHAGQALQLFERKALDHFDDLEPVGLHVDHREVSIDPVDTARARQGVGAALDDLALAALGEMLHHHQNLLRAHREIHRAAHGRDRVCAAGVPVGEVAGHRYLERPQNAEIEVSAADHAEGVGMVKISPARQKRYRLLSGVDEIFVFFAGCGFRPDTEDAVLAVENDLAASWQAVGALRLDECVIGVDRVFQHVIAIADAPGLLALREARAVRRRRIERADPRARRADALGERALRHKLELDLTGAVQRVEMP